MDINYINPITNQLLTTVKLSRKPSSGENIVWTVETYPSIPAADGKVWTFDGYRWIETDDPTVIDVKKNQIKLIANSYNTAINSRFKSGEYWYDSKPDDRTFLIGALLASQVTGSIDYTVYSNQTDITGNKVLHTTGQLGVVLKTGADLINAMQVYRDGLYSDIVNAKTDDDVKKIVWNFQYE